MSVLAFQVTTVDQHLGYFKQAYFVHDSFVDPVMTNASSVYTLIVLIGV